MFKNKFLICIIFLVILLSNVPMIFSDDVSISITASGYYIKVKLVDNQDKTPIEDAVVYFIDETTNEAFLGGYTDSEGKFGIGFGAYTHSYTVKFSNAGYKDLILNGIYPIKGGDYATYSLEQEIPVMEEVVVVSRMPEEKQPQVITQPQQVQLPQISVTAIPYFDHRLLGNVEGNTGRSWGTSGYKPWEENKDVKNVRNACNQGCNKDSACETDNPSNDNPLYNNPNLNSICYDSSGFHEDYCIDENTVAEFGCGGSSEITGSAIKNIFGKITGKAVDNQGKSCFQHVVACSDATYCSTSKGACKKLNVNELIKEPAIQKLITNLELKGKMRDDAEEYIKNILNFYINHNRSKEDIFYLLDENNYNISELDTYVIIFNVLEEKDLAWENKSGWLGLLSLLTPGNKTFDKKNPIYDLKKILPRLAKESLPYVNIKSKAVEYLCDINSNFPGLDVDGVFYEEMKDRSDEYIEFFPSNCPSLKPPKMIKYMFKLQNFPEIYNNNQITNLKLQDSERYSVSLTTYRFMRNNPTYKVGDAIKFVLDKRKSFENQVILGADTYLITFVHQDKRMQPQRLKDYSRERGVKEENIIKDDLKGLEDREAISQTIIESKNKGKTTIWINVHGLPNWICLGGETPESIKKTYNDEENCNGFRYHEFGDILLKRGNLQDVNLIIDSCFSYNFAEQLIDYLERENSNTYPLIITGANKDKYGYGNRLLYSFLTLNLKNNEALLGKHIYEAEQASYIIQDSAVFFSESGKEKSIEISQNYLNHQCLGADCENGVCAISA